MGKFATAIVVCSILAQNAALAADQEQSTKPQPSKINFSMHNLLSHIRSSKRANTSAVQQIVAAEPQVGAY
jgi:hypothetical protein